MSEPKLLLRAYYEALYERLEARKGLVAARIEELLAEEIAKRGFEVRQDEKYTAYLDACLAFVDERIEAYDPVGVHCLFERVSAPEVFELELQLSWFDSRLEFEALVQAVRKKTQTEMSDQILRRLADELIEKLGAFPDSSIISAYEAEPALQKLPDYIVGRAIEEIIR